MEAAQHVQNETQALTQVGPDRFDFDKAESLAARLGYTQTAYTSTSDLWGLFCMRDSGTDRKLEGCIIQTLELGLMFVALEALDEVAS